MTEIESICNKLAEAGKTRGALARIAKEAGVSKRTLYNLLNAPGQPNPMTVSKLVKHFKRESKREAKR